MSFINHAVSLADGIRYVCENFKERSPGSHSERKAQKYLKNELEKYANIGNIAEALVKYKENESQLDIQLREFRKKQNEKQSE